MATILLIDDVELFLELERSLLADTGHHLVSASSAAQALPMLESVEPDLILVDLYMPLLNGDEFCRQLRASERWRDLPVLMVTSAGKDEQIRQCLDAGCDDYVTKPINKTDLLEKVNRLLGNVKGRTARRAAVSLSVKVQADGKSLSAQASDISRNGIFVQSEAKLAEGAVVQLQLELPGGRQLPMLGKVARVKQGPEGGMGIYLVHPNARGLRELAAVTGEELGRDDKSQRDGEEHVQRLQQRTEALIEENRALRERIGELENENRSFAEQIVHTEEVNNNLTNLYIASSRLHSVLRRGQVLEIIKEVVINFVGAEKFAILLCSKGTRTLHFESGEGFDGQAFPEIHPGDGLLWEVLEKDTPYFQEGADEAGSDDPGQPLAAIPLKIHGEPMGLLAIYRLFMQKERFQSVDYQLFSMMADHAVTALFSSGLYEESERKRETYKGFMELLLK